MSLKENLRRREIRNHGYVSANVICDITERSIQKEIDNKIKTTPKYLQDCIRRSALQQLDKADTSTTESRIKNTIKFANTTLEMFINEYNSLPQKNEKSLKALLYSYRTHVAKLNAFDKEVELNNTTYTQKLTDLFAEQICKLDPLFIDILTPKTHSI